MKLKRGSKYLVADPGVRGKRFPPASHYRGRCDTHPKGHVFTVDGSRDLRYCVPDKRIVKLVEPFSKKREAEVEAEAEKYLAKMENRKPEKLVRGWLTAADKRAIAEAQRARWAKLKRAG